MRFLLFFFSIQNSIDWIHFVAQRIVIALANNERAAIQDKPYHKNNSYNTNKNNNINVELLYSSLEMQNHIFTMCKC